MKRDRIRYELQKNENIVQRSEIDDTNSEIEEYVYVGHKSGSLIPVINSIELACSVFDRNSLILKSRMLLNLEKTFDQ